jgi:phosphoesterase RecJ-like protein
MRSKSLNTNDPLSEIARFIRRHSRFAITSHARPDGDSIGSQIGLLLALEALGKVAVIRNADPVPATYRFLPGAEKVELGDPLEGKFDAVIVLECNSLERTGLTGLDHFPCINIDHHVDAGEYGFLNWVDATAGAVAEMVYALIRQLGVVVSSQIADNLYVGILTDTGSFQFANTTAQTFRVSSELVSCGADPGGIAREVYMNKPVARVRLLSRVLQTLELHSSGEIASITLTHKTVLETGAEAGDTEGIVNLPLSVQGVNLVAFFREDGEDEVRVSLRSKSDYDVSQIARHFGGGGHSKAAGLVVQGPLPRAVQEVLPHLEALLNRSK